MHAVEPLMPDPVLVPVRLGWLSRLTAPFATMARRRNRLMNCRTCVRSFSFPANTSALVSMPICLGLRSPACS